MSREHYLQQIEELENDLMGLGDECMELISQSLKSLESEDQDYGREGARR